MVKKEESSLNLKERNISLVLDSYEDIFSSFDPRLPDSRAISDDFLSECKRATLDKGEDLELRLFIPKIKRSYLEEVKIKKRLKEHFLKHHKEKEKERKKVRYSGLIWFFLGVLIMSLETFFIKYREGWIIEFLIIISTPASWFFFWEGLDKIFITSKENKIDYDFYKKMHKSEISFFEY
ncbi:MAG: hypothetical protein WC812_02220 [Candidatus Pacearchaeota archaeon]|jgi:hypothetical protein